MAEAAAKKQSDGRGRPKEDEKTVLERAVVRAREELEARESELEGLLSLLPEEERTPRGRAVRKVASDRMRVAKRLDAAKARVSEARRVVEEVESRDGAKAGQIKAAKQAFRAARREEKQVQDQFNALPDLGATYDEWDKMPAELKVNSVGRPPLPIEIHVHRAEEAMMGALAELNALRSKRRMKPIDADDVADPDAGRARAGRRKLDTLGQLDRRLKIAEQRLAEFEQLPNKETPRNITANGKIRGRKARSKAEKIAIERKEIAEITQLIKQFEARMSPAGRAERKLKKLRDNARELRAEIKQQALPRNSSEAKSLRRLEKAIEEQVELVESKKTTAKGAARPVRKATTTKAQTSKRTEELRAKEAEVEDLFRELEEAIERQREIAGDDSEAVQSRVKKLEAMRKLHGHAA
ncbi:DNA repair exonuclease SbcCD ATPase subunit [Natronocella acetinitrilica]|uniref:DNA repair exonuclease SbcCD ATPase subunit n=1 Tax=Natronocella acetinitrilica TaxID=414046 RepID=A0AAE3G2I1_9GAMM|nr:hypothetical protein [Natronocella acetinitrilica]MCP1674222.1 DNA repair exonuclease SbcCD ATPase subunit [Natronocella acetinitrilica]